MCKRQYVGYRCGHTREKETLPCRSHQKKQADGSRGSKSSHCGNVRKEERTSSKCCSASCQQTTLAATGQYAYGQYEYAPASAPAPAPTSFRQRAAERYADKPLPPLPTRSEQRRTLPATFAATLPPRPGAPKPESRDRRHDNAYASHASTGKRTYRPNTVFGRTRVTSEYPEYYDPDPSYLSRYGYGYGHGYGYGYGYEANHDYRPNPVVARTQASAYPAVPADCFLDPSYYPATYRPNPVFASAPSSPDGRKPSRSRSTRTSNTSKSSKSSRSLFSLLSFGWPWVKGSKSSFGRSSRRDSAASFVCRGAASAEKQRTSSSRR